MIASKQSKNIKEFGFHDLASCEGGGESEIPPTDAGRIPCSVQFEIQSEPTHIKWRLRGVNYGSNFEKQQFTLKHWPLAPENMAN